MANRIDPEHLAEIEEMIRIELERIWAEEQREIDHLGTDPSEFKSHQLPLARIKKIMKSDEDVRMIASEAPLLFAKACEFFILELTQRAWALSEDNKRKTLQRTDIARAVAHTDTLDFLQDIITMEPVVAGPGQEGAARTGGAGAGPSSQQQQPSQAQPSHQAQPLTHAPPPTLQPPFLQAPDLRPPSDLHPPPMFHQQHMTQHPFMQGGGMQGGVPGEMNPFAAQLNSGPGGHNGQPGVGHMNFFGGQ